MPRKNLTQDEFITIFNSSDSYNEILARTGLSMGAILNRARLLRKKGIEVKRFPLNYRTGIVTWLKENYPDVYQDLKINYPDVYNRYYNSK